MDDASSEKRRGRVVEVEAVVRRVIAARVPDPCTADDLVQDTMARLFQARSALSEGALVGYAVASARNSVVSYQRRQHRWERLEPKLVEPDMPVDPEAAVIASEERQAIRDALQALEVDERRWLLAHEVDQVPIADLADQTGATPAALAARLARARAKLRVEYLLVLRRVRLPTPRCRPVLLALSAGDRRRQESLGVGSHLVSCRPCAVLSDPLVTRRRGLAALWPFPALERLVGHLWQRVKDHPAQSAGAAVASGLVVAVLLVAGRADSPPPPPAVCEPNVNAGGRVVPLSDNPALAATAGTPVQVPALVVVAVPANEGFWAGCVGSRLWVQLEGQGESPFRIQPGQRVALQGVIQLNPPDFTATVGLSAHQGAAELDRQGLHLRARHGAVRLI